MADQQIQERAEKAYPETATNSQTHPNVHMHNNEQTEKQRAYTSALTEERELMSNQWVSEINSLLEKAIANISTYEITGDVEVYEDLYNQGIERSIKGIRKIMAVINKG